MNNTELRHLPPPTVTSRQVVYDAERVILA